ncbi:MAG: inositol phosphorylceramide synthase [SAR202 cluster bacterium]|nr:inositol phosphorylceramide synthase [SAR202 cluster bacterium]MQG54394.1 inositol phosphorylceramide synthase [SAR202 cluster bacterium]
MGGVNAPPDLDTSGHRKSLIMASIKSDVPHISQSRLMLPHLREIGIVVGAYFIYMYSRALVFSDFQGTALANARRVIDFEKSTGFFWEPVWQSWAIESAKSLVIFFNWAYIVTFFPIVLTASIVLYFTNRARYKYYRNVVLLSFLIALVGFMLFPLAPPRMIAEHFVDTINIFGPSGYASREFTNYYNAYAAMPSLHFGWTVMFGIIFLGTNSRLVKVFGVVYPIMTLFAITITGNHFIMDAIGGGLLIMASFLAMELGFRRRFFVPVILSKARAKPGEV